MLAKNRKKDQKNDSSWNLIKPLKLYMSNNGHIIGIRVNAEKA